MLLFLLACDPAPPPPATPSFTLPSASSAAPVAADPRAAADQAFNDAMQAFETGQPTAGTAVPRAIAAYEAVGQLDTDGLFHLALLHLAAGDAKAARITSEQVLAQRPTHLLALASAGKAATQLGDAAAAKGYYERLDAAFDAEQGKVPEYAHHAVLLPIYREEAKKALGK
ncbi:MAG: hypothetical protein ACOZNI_31720 [Myxococcota bacterium]